MFRVFKYICLVTLLGLYSLSLARAGFVDPLIQYKSFPQCDDAQVLKSIVSRFNSAEKKTWQRGFNLANIERIRERLVQKDEERSSIPRRYCRGHSRLTNGKHPTIYYLIEAGQGFAGNGFNVEFCLGGYDRWNEYDGSCRALRY